MLYLIMLSWNIWHVKIYLQWPIIYGKYGLGWQWPMLHNTLTVAIELILRRIKWLENYFSDEQKQKDAEAAAHFHIKAAKIAHVIIILRKFVQEDLISAISFLLARHRIFICSIWFKGGERYAIKLFPISICFIVKKHCFCPKLSLCSISKGKTYSIIIKFWIQGNFSAKTVIFHEALFFSKTIGIHTPTTVRGPFAWNDSSL